MALACLGRIHTCVLRMGREVVGVLREVVPQLRGVVGMVVARIEKGGGGMVMGRGMEYWNELKNAVRPLLVEKLKVMPLTVTTATAKATATATTTTKTATATTMAQDEWNELMAQFLEVSHDDLNKQMYGFVREKRWEDMICSFGLGKERRDKDGGNDGNERTNNLNFLNTHALQNDGDDEVDHEASDDFVSMNLNSDCDDNNDENGASISNVDGSDMDFEMERKDDMGELIDDVDPNLEEGGLHDNSGKVDDNMARIMKIQKDRRLASSQGSNKSNRDENDSTLLLDGTSDALLDKRKKNKRKKKKMRISEEINSVDSHSMGDTDGRNSALVDKTAISEEGCASNEANIASNDSTAGELSKSNKRKQIYDVDENDYDKEEELSTKPKEEQSAVTAQQTAGGTVASPSEIANNNKTAKSKSKKKSSKKSKKKQRSSNVIDDIFG